MNRSKASVAAVLVVVAVVALLLWRGSDATGPTVRDSTGSTRPGASAGPATPGSPTARRTPTATGAVSATQGGDRDPETGLRWVSLDRLPRQARDTVGLIEQGGPFPHRQGGATFANRERVLPRQPAGFYREYTVQTPGSDDRGARRIVTGDDDRQFFYTGDHYASFVRIRR